MRRVSAAWLGLAVFAVGAPSEGGGIVVDITDPAAVSWAGILAIPAVTFVLSILGQYAWIERHRAVAALVISEAGAFLFGVGVVSEWRVLAAQGLAVAMGALGLQATVNRARNGQGI